MQIYYFLNIDYKDFNDLILIIFLMICEKNKIKR